MLKGEEQEEKQKQETKEEESGTGKKCKLINKKIYELGQAKKAR